MMPYAFLARIVLGATVLVVAGCGAGVRMSPNAEMISRADTICHTLNVHLETTFDHNKPYLTHLGHGLASAEWTALSELRKLTPPRNLSSDWTMVLTGLQTLAERTSRAVREAKLSSTHTPFTYLTEDEYVGQRAAAIAERDGFTECAHVTLWHNI